MGISRKTNKWIENFLSNQKQKVYLTGAISSLIKVDSDVPQGAVLSVFFKVFKTFSVSLYADNAKLYAQVLVNNYVQYVQNDINSLVKWCKTGV